jgi:cell division protein FtsB
MAPSDPNALALPSNFSPDTIDVLTELSTVLTKVHAGLQSSTGLATDPATQTQAQQQQQQQQLSFKDVPGATDGIKHKLQRAREHVAALPDMGRTLAEQEEEMAQLRARMDRQRALLERLRDGGVAFAKDEGSAAASGERMET